MVWRLCCITLLCGCSYGLLGPSGCGKTTLLRSMVGMTQLDAGNIHLKAQKKNNVGYMPQVRHGPEDHKRDDAGQYNTVVDLSIEHIVTKIWIQSVFKIKISNLKPFNSSRSNPAHGLTGDLEVAPTSSYLRSCKIYKKPSVIFKNHWEIWTWKPITPFKCYKQID